jgi:hypothetical protein
MRSIVAPQFILAKFFAGLLSSSKVVRLALSPAKETAADIKASAAAMRQLRKTRELILNVPKS